MRDAAGGCLPPVNRPLAGGLAPRAGEGWRGRSAAAVAVAWILSVFGLERSWANRWQLWLLHQNAGAKGQNGGCGWLESALCSPSAVTCGWLLCKVQPHTLRKGRNAQNREHFRSGPLAVVYSTFAVTTADSMTSTKTATLNLRIERALKDALKHPTESEHCSNANMVKVRIRNHCSRYGIAVEAAAKEHRKRGNPV